MSDKLTRRIRAIAVSGVLVAVSACPHAGPRPVNARTITLGAVHLTKTSVLFCRDLDTRARRGRPAWAAGRERGQRPDVAAETMDVDRVDAPDVQEQGVARVRGAPATRAG
jgi:hypothetical protein